MNEISSLSAAAAAASALRSSSAAPPSTTSIAFALARFASEIEFASSSVPNDTGRTSARLTSESATSEGLLATAMFDVALPVCSSLIVANCCADCVAPQLINADPFAYYSRYIVIFF